MAKIKKVFKFATGDIIPEGSLYLCTRQETLEKEEEKDGKTIYMTQNLLVWHYFLVDVEE